MKFWQSALFAQIRLKIAHPASIPGQNPEYDNIYFSIGDISQPVGQYYN
jgi:hypothetical protein